MSKTRVKNGEKYWFINTNAAQTNMWADWDMEGNYPSIDKARLKNGNYFNTKEDAEVCARKLRAVLKGADVIEMPSEEEIESVASKIGHNIEKQGIISSGAINGYITNGCKSMAEFFNNKIVK